MARATAQKGLAGLTQLERLPFPSGQPINQSIFEERIVKEKVSRKTNRRRSTTSGGSIANTRYLKAAATKEIAAAINGILSDVFALYLKTKNFHWHMSGPHFRDHYVMLDEQATQIYEMTAPIAERIRTVGGSKLRSIGHIARTQRILDNDADFVELSDMLGELCDDNKTLASQLREAHSVCEEHDGIAKTILIEVYIDETERRICFLFEASRPHDMSGH